MGAIWKGDVPERDRLCILEADFDGEALVASSGLGSTVVAMALVVLVVFSITIKESR